MTTPIIGTNYAPPTSLSLPVAFNDLNPMDALGGLPVPVGAYTFGGSSVEGSCRNFANPDLPLLPIGSPTINAVGASLDYLNGFDTQLPETAAFTLLAISKPVSFPQSYMITNAGGDSAANHYSPYGVTLWATLTRVSTGDPTAVPVDAVNDGWFLNAGDWAQYMGRGDATNVKTTVHGANALDADGNGGKIRDMTAVATGSRGLNGKTLRIGAMYQTGPMEFTSSYPTPVPMLAAFIWNTKLSDADALAVFTALKTWFNTTSGLGITTL